MLGTDHYFSNGGSQFCKINCLHANISTKNCQQKNFFKKIVCTTLVKLESLFYCNVLDAIICGVW